MFYLILLLISVTITQNFQVENDNLGQILSLKTEGTASAVASLVRAEFKL